MKDKRNMYPIERRDLCKFATRCVNSLFDSHLVQNGPGWIRAWYDFGLKWSETEPAYVLSDVSAYGTDLRFS
jgi:hypothetical protein